MSSEARGRKSKQKGGFYPSSAMTFGKNRRQANPEHVNEWNALPYPQREKYNYRFDIFVESKRERN